MHGAPKNLVRLLSTVKTLINGIENSLMNILEKCKTHLIQIPFPCNNVETKQCLYNGNSILF